jgi:DNA repair photolyase
MEKKCTEELNELIRTKRKQRQWADKTINFITGCRNQCKYCYSCEMATRLRKHDPANWGNEIVRQKDVNRRMRKKHPRNVMFPSSHDIRPNHLPEAIQVLEHILNSGNEVLVTSKPNLYCIKKICETFTGYRDKILFRFTIGSLDSLVLKFWEPEAPSFNERFECLKLAYNMGYKTSVSAEPLLDKDVHSLIRRLSPYVTDTIWIGKAEQLRKRLTMNGYNDPITIANADELMEWQNDPMFISDLYEKYKDNPMIRWKTSYLKEMAKIEKLG